MGAAHEEEAGWHDENGGVEERRVARGRVGQGATAGGRSVARDGRRRGQLGVVGCAG